MKVSQRTTVSLYGKVYNVLIRYKKMKEQEIGLRLNLQQVISMLLMETSPENKINGTQNE